MTLSVIKLNTIFKVIGRNTAQPAPHKVLFSETFLPFHTSCLWTCSAFSLEKNLASAQKKKTSSKTSTTLQQRPRSLAIRANKNYKTLYYYSRSMPSLTTKLTPEQLLQYLVHSEQEKRYQIIFSRKLSMRCQQAILQLSAFFHDLNSMTARILTVLLICQEMALVGAKQILVE